MRICIQQVMRYMEIVFLGMYILMRHMEEVIRCMEIVFLGMFILMCHMEEVMRCMEIVMRIYKDSLHRNFLTQCPKPNSMIVLSDANILSNDFREKSGPLECGYYKYTDQYFANKTFVLNCLEYLTDNYGLLEARNKNIKLRLLDMAKVKKEKLQWQVINNLIPIGLVLFFASGYFFFRKKKYEQRM